MHAVICSASSFCIGQLQFIAGLHGGTSGHDHTLVSWVRGNACGPASDDNVPPGPDLKMQLFLRL